MITDNLLIRCATKRDIKDIMKIESDCFPPGIRENKSVFLERIKIFNDGFLVILDKLTQRCLGYICSEIWDYNDSIKQNNFALGHSIKAIHNPLGEELYIVSTGVLREYRGLGYGSYLFIELLNKLTMSFPKLISSVLIVSSSWIPARKIYQKNGYKEITTIKKFFKPKNENYSDGIVMRKLLCD